MHRVSDAVPVAVSRFVDFKRRIRDAAATASNPWTEVHGYRHCIAIAMLEEFLRRPGCTPD